MQHIIKLVEALHAQLLRDFGDLSFNLIYCLVDLVGLLQLLHIRLVEYLVVLLQLQVYLLLLGEGLLQLLGIGLQLGLSLLDLELASLDRAQVVPLWLLRNEGTQWGSAHEALLVGTVLRKPLCDQFRCRVVHGCCSLREL